MRILIEKHCAFVNFERPQAAADALNGLQVCVIEFHLTASLPLCRVTILEEVTC